MWKIIKIRDLIVFQICTFIRFGLKPFNKLVLLSFFSRWGSSAGGKLKSQWTQPPTKESWWLTTWPSSSNPNRMKSASRPSRASERATQPYGSSPTAVSAEPPPSHAQRPVPLLLSHTVWQRVPCLTCGDPRNDGIDGDAWICVWEWTSESRIHQNPSWSCQTPPPESSRASRNRHTPTLGATLLHINSLDLSADLSHESSGILDCRRGRLSVLSLLQWV